MKLRKQLKKRKFRLDNNVSSSTLRYIELKKIIINFDFNISTLKKIIQKINIIQQKCDA